MNKIKYISILLWYGSVFMTSAVSAEDNKAKSDAPDKKMVTEKPMHFESKGSVRIDGKTIDYTTTAGTLVMKNDKDEPIAQFGYTAYVKAGKNKSNRPIMFAYNGGPGSASLWLHMGILGPKRVVVTDSSAP